jgi:hypothetical protein
LIWAKMVVSLEKKKKFWSRFAWVSDFLYVLQSFSIFKC